MGSKKKVNPPKSLSKFLHTTNAGMKQTPGTLNQRKEQKEVKEQSLLQNNKNKINQKLSLPTFPKN